MRTAMLAACSLALTGCVFENFDSGERYQSDFRFSYPLNGGASFKLENSNGSIEISGWDQNTVEITGTKYARTEALRDEIKIDIDHSSDSVSVRTVEPFTRNGNMGARYVIRVPRRVQLDRVVSTNGGIRVSDVEGNVHLRTSNGAAHAGHIEGDVEAQTTNGVIEATEISGSAHLHTSNGHVRVEAVKGRVEATSSNGGIRIHESFPGGMAGMRLSTSNGPVEVTVEKELRSDLHATTTNGSITVHMPAETAARVSASTSHQAIRSDFDVTMKGRIDKHHLEGTIGEAGAGSPSIELSTTNGQIRLLRM